MTRSAAGARRVRFERMPEDQSDLSEANEDDAEPPWSAFEATDELLTLVFADDHEGLRRVRDSIEDEELWNVTITLAFLLRDVFRGRPAGIRVLAGILEQAEGLENERAG
jgi:hypothetical protein